MWEPELYETGRPMHEDKGERLPARAHAGLHNVANMGYLRAVRRSYGMARVRSQLLQVSTRPTRSSMASRIVPVS